MITYEIKQKINLDEIIILSGSIGMAGGAICRILRIYGYGNKDHGYVHKCKDFKFCDGAIYRHKILKSLDYFLIII